MLKSDYRLLCSIELPYQGRQMYMHTFELANPVMAEGYEDYLGPVTELCRAAKAISGLAHMTVDEKVIQPGRSQRRSGPHVDGCFMPAANSWDHGPGPSWLHYCNDIGRYGGYAVVRMAVIIAASAQGCRAWRGDFEGQPRSDGDLSHIADQFGRSEVLAANAGYLISPDCVHESMIMRKPTQRTFLRIALPVDYKF